MLSAFPLLQFGFNAADALVQILKHDRLEGKLKHHLGSPTATASFTSASSRMVSSLVTAAAVIFCIRESVCPMSCRLAPWYAWRSA